MATNKNRAEYQQRVNRVTDFIREHRADELSLEALAQLAAFSPFHFHRVFKAMTGENLGEFIQRCSGRTARSFASGLAGDAPLRSDPCEAATITDSRSSRR